MNRYVYSQINRGRIAAVLIGLFAFFSIFYAYFLQETARQVVERKQLSQEITALRSDIGDVEFNYGSAISEVTRERATQLGYQPVDDPRYVARTNRGTMVTLNVAR